MRAIGPLFGSLQEIPQNAAKSEALGFDGIYSAEINNDPFFPLLLAAEHSQRVELMTSIAVAFARNPMTLANLSHDLNQYSEGRFVLGIGSQIKPHITRRMSMPWSKPAARMREFILAMQAIWRCWLEDAPLEFNGEFYRHDLMTPMFVPSARDFPAPKVKLAGVGPLMTEVAGEVADGLIAHGFTTAKYLREVTLPAVERGLAKSNRSREDFDVVCPVIAVCGETEEKFVASMQTVKMQLAFYASTPAYRPVLELHGWGDVQTEAHRMSKAGQWQAMGELIDDDILNTFAVVAEKPEQLAAKIKAHCGGLVDSWECTWISEDDEALRSVLSAIRAS